MIFFLIVALVVIALVVFFAVQNVDPVTITFLAWSFEQPLAYVLVAIFILGVLIALILSIPGMIRRGGKVVSQKKRIAELEKETEKLQAKIGELEQGLEKMEAQIEMMSPPTSPETASPAPPPKPSLLPKPDWRSAAAKGIKSPRATAPPETAEPPEPEEESGQKDSSEADTDATNPL